MHMREELQEIALKHAERFVHVGDVMLSHSPDNAQINSGNQFSSIMSGAASKYTHSLGEALYLRQEAPAKLVLAHEPINQDQIQERHLGKKIPRGVIQD